MVSNKRIMMNNQSEILSRQRKDFTPEEYLQMEETSPIKHEYIDGYIYEIDRSINFGF
jgi:Uma2 family endonuclease